MARRRRAAAGSSGGGSGGAAHQLLMLALVRSVRTDDDLMDNSTCAGSAPLMIWQSRCHGWPRCCCAAAEEASLLLLGWVGTPTNNGICLLPHTNGRCCCYITSTGHQR